MDFNCFDVLISKKKLIKNILKNNHYHNKIKKIN